MRNRSGLTLLAAAALLATQPGASCVTDSTSSSSGSSSPSSGDAPLDNDRVPDRAEIAKEGRGTLEYTADADGTIWVQDVREESTIVSHRVHRGEKVRVVPDEDRVFLEGSRIGSGDIKRDNAHRIYLLRDRRFEDRVRRDRADREDRATRDEPAKVPTGSELIGETQGKDLASRPRRDGRLYVYDADAKKVVCSVRVRDGERIVFSPADDRITIDGIRAVERDFSEKTHYRVYQGR